MFLFHKGQTIDNRYTMVFPHKIWTCAETRRGGLFPQRFILVPSWKSHCSGAGSGIHLEQSLDVLRESVRRIDAVEPVGDVAQMGIEFVAVNLLVGNPRMGKMTGKVWLDHDVCVPKAGMVGADVTYNSNAPQPVAHILKLWNAKTAADGLLCGTVVHVGVKLGKRSERCYLQCLPYGRHGRCIVFLEMLQDELIFRTIQFFLQAVDIVLMHDRAVCQSRVQKPKGTMTLREYTDEASTNSNFDALDGCKDEQAQLFIKVIETDYQIEMGVWLKNMTLLVCLHQSPIACQAEVADGVKNRDCFCLIVDYKSSLLQNIYLLLESEELLGVSHKRINKKWPALVRYIPCGREAAAGSIRCKGTTFISIRQIFWRKSA